jgi:hypothetical protein
VWLVASGAFERVLADVAQDGGPEPVLAVIRAGVVVLLLLAIANGVSSTCSRSQAAARSASAVKPSVSVAGTAAGYLAGDLATALAA